MRVELKSGNKFYCDVCGEEIKDCAGFKIKFDYGGEDPCWGCFHGEGELFKELDKDDGELYDAVYNYLQQDMLIQCRHCRSFSDNNNYISNFEESFREARVRIVRKLALEKKLPEFFEDKEEKKEQIAQLDTRKKNLLSEIKEIDKARELLTKTKEKICQKKKI